MVSFICPICKSHLKSEKQSLLCKNRHCFDRAKEGYVNLLPVNSKNSRDPGDNSRMMMARRSFLESGYYEPLAQEISHIINSLTQNRPATLLDCGCGEGYYTGYIKEHNKILKVLGLDISRTAIRYASKKYKEISFCVASAYDIPVGNEALDIMLRIYAPSSESEVIRTIRKGGFLIAVTPGERHLFQIREMMYQDIRKQSEEKEETGKLKSVKTSELQYTLEIHDYATLKNLLDMTPFGWKISDTAREKLAVMESWKIDCHFHIEVFIRGEY